MKKPNNHDWSLMFYGDQCRLCYRSIATGTGKAEHAKGHIRTGHVERPGDGSKGNPFRYVPTGIDLSGLTSAATRGNAAPGFSRAALRRKESGAFIKRFAHRYGMNIAVAMMAVADVTNFLFENPKSGGAK